MGVAVNVTRGLLTCPGGCFGVGWVDHSRHRTSLMSAFRSFANQGLRILFGPRHEALGKVSLLARRTQARIVQAMYQLLGQALAGLGVAPESHSGSCSSVNSLRRGERVRVRPHALRIGIHGHGESLVTPAFEPLPRPVRGVTTRWNRSTIPPRCALPDTPRDAPRGPSNCRF